MTWTAGSSAAQGRRRRQGRRALPTSRPSITRKPSAGARLGSRRTGRPRCSTSTRPGLSPTSAPRRRCTTSWCAGPAGPEAAHHPEPGDQLDDLSGRDDVHLQAPAGRQVPRWDRLHGGRREGHVRPDRVSSAGPHQPPDPAHQGDGGEGPLHRRDEALRAPGHVHVPGLACRRLERHHQQEGARPAQGRPEAGGQLPGHGTLHVQEPDHRVVGAGPEPELLEPERAVRRPHRPRVAEGLDARAGLGAARRAGGLGDVARPERLPEGEVQRQHVGLVWWRRTWARGSASTTSAAVQRQPGPPCAPPGPRPGCAQQDHPAVRRDPELATTFRLRTERATRS